MFELRAAGKERLMSTLTNIECPSKSAFLAYDEKDQMLILSHGKNINLINTKNSPFYAGGNHKSAITAGIYDEESNLIGCADEDGTVIFYNICFKP